MKGSNNSSAYVRRLITPRQGTRKALIFNTDPLLTTGHDGYEIPISTYNYFADDDHNDQDDDDDVENDDSLDFLATVNYMGYIS